MLLKSRYDRPRLIQRTHVQLIVDTPPLKEGSGKELRRLHDNVQQHVPLRLWDVTYLEGSSPR